MHMHDFRKLLKSARMHVFEADCMTVLCVLCRLVSRCCCRLEDVELDKGAHPRLTYEGVF